MSEYRATPEQWENIAEYAKDLNSGAACVLELRARVEALEATQHAHVNLSGLPEAERQQLVKSLGQSANVQLLETTSKPSPNSSQIGSSLVERVRKALSYPPEPYARAAIREVAAWLREQRTYYDSSVKLAQTLEQEAGNE